VCGFEVSAAFGKGCSVSSFFLIPFLLWAWSRLGDSGGRWRVGERSRVWGGEGAPTMRLTLWFWRRRSRPWMSSRGGGSLDVPMGVPWEGAEGEAEREGEGARGQRERREWEGARWQGREGETGTEESEEN